MKILKHEDPEPNLSGCACGRDAMPRVTAAQGEITEYYALDAIGSVRVVFDSGGAVTARMDYVPFGADLSGAADVPKERFGGVFRDGEVPSAAGSRNGPEPRRGLGCVLGLRDFVAELRA